MEQVLSAEVNLQLPGEKWMATTHFAIRDHRENILDFDVLKGWSWCLPTLAFTLNKMFDIIKYTLMKPLKLYFCVLEKAVFVWEHFVILTLL